MKKLAQLDHPHADSMMDGKLESGNFGEAPKDISDLTGIKCYNLQWEMEYSNTKTLAVLNDQGILN